MPQEMPDSDWKLLRKVFDDAYARFCSRALQELRAVLNDELSSDSEKFDNLKAMMKNKAKDSHSIFDSFNFSRSNAMIIMVMLANWKLISADDLKGFSQATRDRISRNLAGD